MSTLLSVLAASLKRTVTADVKVKKHCLQVLILLETVNNLNCVVLQLHSEFASQDNQVSCRLGWLGGNQSRWYKSLLKPKTWADVLLKTREHFPSSQNTPCSPLGVCHPHSHKPQGLFLHLLPSVKINELLPPMPQQGPVSDGRSGRRGGRLLCWQKTDRALLISGRWRGRAPQRIPRPVRPVRHFYSWANKELLDNSNLLDESEFVSGV